jgi:hypothetical protein
MGLPYAKRSEGLQAALGEFALIAADLKKF